MATFPIRASRSARPALPMAGGFVLGIKLLLLFLDHWRIVVAVLIGLAALTMLARNLLRS